MKALKLKWLIGLILISNFVAGCAFDLAHVDFKTVTISSMQNYQILEEYSSIE
jgi:hypothetical protein